ncbi:MAG TPA: hypothetical protein DEP84_28310 [Chloroflexi bacterium]|nr:hypothetical protein [Chloroflexota bacterium]
MGRWPTRARARDSGDILRGGLERGAGAPRRHVPDGSGSSRGRRPQAPVRRCDSARAAARARRTRDAPGPPAGQAI